MMPYTGSALFRNIAAQFDRRVRNAFPAVENIRLENGARRAGVDASRAGSAAIGNGCVIRQLEIGKDAPQKQPGANLLINDAGIFPEPADAGVFRIYALQQWARIHIGFSALRRILFEPDRELPQLFLDGIVIVLAPRIT